MLVGQIEKHWRDSLDILKVNQNLKYSLPTVYLDPKFDINNLQML